MKMYMMSNGPERKMYEVVKSGETVVRNDFIEKHPCGCGGTPILKIEHYTSAYENHDIYIAQCPSCGWMERISTVAGKRSQEENIAFVRNLWSRIMDDDNWRESIRLCYGKDGRKAKKRRWWND